MRQTLISTWRAALILLAAPIGAQAQTVYHGFTMVDVVERRLIANAFVVVDGGRIAAVGRGRPPAHATWRYVKMSGQYALPGFIDAHAHLTVGPRTIEVNDGVPVMKEATSDSITQFNALVALASGVTTIRNPGGVPAANVRYQEQHRLGAWLGPDAIQAGTLFGGYPLEWASQPSGAEAWRAAIDQEVRFGFPLVKLYVGLSEGDLATGISAAESAGLRTVAHLDRISWTRAARLGVDALTHALPTSEDLLLEPARSAYIESRKAPSAKYMYQWWEAVDLESAPMRELVRTLAELQVEVDLTLVVNELVYWWDRADSLQVMQRNDWMHPAHRAPWRRQLRASMYDWSPADFARAKRTMTKVLEFARRLHDAGVPLLIGTDGTGGGPFYSRELALHRDAGISTWDVLSLATVRGAERIGMADRKGALRVGFDADIVFLGANPVADVSNTSRVTTVVVRGQTYTAADLMARAQGFAGGVR
jgi:imidazolonepropionase-like amidohydrolase